MDNPPREAKCFFTSRQGHGSYRSEVHGNHTALHAAPPLFNHEQKHRQLSSRPERGESFSLSPAPARGVEGSRECCLGCCCRELPSRHTSTKARTPPRQYRRPGQCLGTP